MFHTFSTVNSTFTLDETRGSFAAVQDTVVENNEVGPKVESIGGKQSTRATKSAKIAPGKKTVEIDFGPDLLFSAQLGIASVRCSHEGRFPTAISTEINGNQVKVYLEDPVPAKEHSPAVA